MALTPRQRRSATLAGPVMATAIRKRELALGFVRHIEGGGDVPAWVSAQRGLQHEMLKLGYANIPTPLGPCRKDAG